MTFAKCARSRCMLLLVNVGWQNLPTIGHGNSYSASKPTYRSAHASKQPSTACVCPSSDASPHPKLPSASVTLTNSHRGGTRKYSIVANLPMIDFGLSVGCPQLALSQVSWSPTPAVGSTVGCDTMSIALRDEAVAIFIPSPLCKCRG
jgi:hypothetical protein